VRASGGKTNMRDGAAQIPPIPPIEVPGDRGSPFMSRMTTRERSVGWDSSLGIAARGALGLWVALMIVAAFVYAPENASFAQMARGTNAPHLTDMGQLYRIIFFHVPAAWVAVLGFLVAMVYAVRYLRRREMEDDAKSSLSAEPGFVVCLIALVTGMILAKTTCGDYWSSAPRETSIFVLLLIYGAYFALRSAVENETRRAALAAVYAILAFITVPYLVFIAPRVTESLHPSDPIVSRGKMVMDPRMLSVLIGSLIGFSGIYLWIWRLQLRIARLRRRMEEE